MALNRFHQPVSKTHILISFKENPSFSLYHTRLGRDCKNLNRKNWLGFNAAGIQRYYTNDIDVCHILIQDCSREQFNKAVTSENIKFRVVEENELEKIPDKSEFKLAVESVLKKATEELPASQTQTIKPY